MSFPCRLRCFPSAWLSLVICRVSRTETIEPKHPISSEFRPGSLILGTVPVQHKLAADAVLDNTACVREEPAGILQSRSSNAARITTRTGVGCFRSGKYSVRVRT